MPVINQNAYDAILALLHARGVPYQLISHPPCGTSEESERMRTAAGFPNVVGAKALVIRARLDTGATAFFVLVIPGRNRLDKTALIAALPQIKRFSFATPDELMTQCGVVPGTMPPYGPAIFAGLDGMVVDPGVTTAAQIGFNIADFEQSVIMSGEAYVQTIEPALVARISQAS